MKNFSITTHAVAGFAAASLITFGGIFLSPTTATPVAAGPTTSVPVELRQSEPGRIVDGEVTTTIFSVSGTGAAAKVGGAVATTDTASFSVGLANGQYLVSSTPKAGSRLVNLDDTDGPAAVPPSAGCGDRLGCTWIWVNNAQEHNTWGLLAAPNATHDELEFTFSRPAPTAAPQPRSAPAPTPAPSTGTATASVPVPDVAASPTQFVDVVVTELIEGSDVAVPNVATVLQYFPESSGVPHTLGGPTDQTGTIDFTMPIGRYLVIVVPPAGYRIVSHSAPGINSALSPDEGTSVSVELERIPVTIPNTAPTGGPGQTSDNAIPSAPTGSPTAPSSVPTSTVPTPESTEPESTSPTSTVPAPVPAPTVPSPTTTVVDEPVPSTPTPTMVDQGQIGCDETNDPELAALLAVDDGVVRWLVNGELRTALPDDGAVPIIVCEAAYQRLLDMGFDSAFIALG